MPRYINLNHDLYTCDYHVKGVECSTHKVNAGSMLEAVMLCGNWIDANYPNQYYQILSVTIVENKEE